MKLWPLPRRKFRISKAALIRRSWPGRNTRKGIPIYAESDLVKLIAEKSVDQVVFAYSDVPHELVMHRASLVNAAGADFRLMGTHSTQLKSSKPVVSVCAVRTGSGKSQTTRRVSKILRAMGYRVAAIRHPMPYGDLVKQAVERFASYEDLDKYECTIEEREEYEPHLANGVIVYAGVDYGAILRQAEQEVDIVLWDGGNNDFPFYKSDLQIVVADPHRPGHELSYHPGETNARSGGCFRDQQSRYGLPRRRRPGARQSALGKSQCDRHRSRLPLFSWMTRRPSRASACWSSKTAPP